MISFHQKWTGFTEIADILQNLRLYFHISSMSQIHAEREYNSRTSELYLHKYNIQNFVDQYVES